MAELNDAEIDRLLARAESAEAEVARLTALLAAKEQELADATTRRTETVAMCEQLTQEFATLTARLAAVVGAGNAMQRWLEDHVAYMVNPEYHAGMYRVTMGWRAALAGLGQP